MAKKDKHVPKNGETQTQEAPAQEAPQTQASSTDSKPKGKPFVGKPARHLKDSNGNTFKFTPFALPKKAAQVGSVTIDGATVTYQVTSNKGFTKPDTVINYSWFTLPDGTTGYIAHDYNTEPVKDMAYTLHDGAGDRKDPERVPKDATVGEERIAKFKATQAKKAADKAAVAPAAGTEAGTSAS